ncbi:DEAD/DEAH box helicase [Peribacillus simplex]|uniref:DEAD/DEAH box helicase n=1 Tax=Peribacillus TaxID=2675229 RepID=UPI000BA72514|nr:MULTISPECIES: DEAD/DEAH box helicase [Peribacillus]MBX9955486.1 DEAD/DEAH box helicase [Peribacillus simplex]PAL11749.1 RNA helicase [Peribacillus simplex]
MSELPALINDRKPYIQAVWKKSGFGQLTPIQTKAIPVIVEGKDIMAESPTGTGKTLAYLLPLLEKIDPEKKSPQALILASSRELVMQINEEIRIWSEGSGITGAAFIGGANVKRQLDKLKKRPQVIAGTPGRIYELIAQKKLKMHEVKTIVLDEGDQLIIPEHMGTINNIIKTTLKDRQIMVFSATLPEETEKAAREFMNEPEMIKVDKHEKMESKVDHLYFVVERREKSKILEKITRLKDVKALAFLNDIAELSVLHEKLSYKGIEMGVLHGESNKVDREKALRKLRSGKSPMLIATDVAARGLDIKGLTAVVHIDMADNIEQYIHRSGRTGRAGADGTVISIVTEREERELKKMARELEIPLTKVTFYGGNIVVEE